MSCAVSCQYDLAECEGCFVVVVVVLLSNRHYWRNNLNIYGGSQSKRREVIYILYGCVMYIQMYIVIINFLVDSGQQYNKLSKNMAL